MPKLAEAEDGSDPDTIKISTIHYFWPSIAKPVNRSACGIGFGPMKGTVRPLFSILVLSIFATTLSFRTVPGALQMRGNVLLQLQSPPMRVVFNDTLLKYAAIEIGQAQAKQEVEQLLEGNLASQGRYRSFATWRRFNTHDTTRERRSSLVVRSPQFYRYWLDFRRVLQEWVRKKRFEAEIMSELVRQMKHPIDRHNGLSVGLGRKRYSSCAVVGNSGILLKSDYGKLIDSHEFVIRLNNARTGSFERNVGSKTNASFVNSNILHFCGRRAECFCHPYGIHVPMIVYICQPVHLLDYTMCNTTHKSPLLVTDPRFDMLCSRIVKYYSLKLFAEETGKSLEQWSVAHDGANFHYSSGMQAVMLALGICDQVSVFGFGKSDSAKHHYHTKQKEELGLHDYEAEYAFYRDVADKPEEIPFISGKFKFPPLVIYQ